jgi:hypothetical protein
VYPFEKCNRATTECDAGVAGEIMYLRCVAIVLEFTATFDVTSSQTVAAYL